MYDNQYEEYIRNILGYPNSMNVTQNRTYQNEYPNPTQVSLKSDLEECYPEIYKIIYPMIKKACEGNMRANKEDIDRVTDEIYLAIEGNNQINLNINLENPVSTSNTKITQNRNDSNKENAHRKDLDKQSVENRNIIPEKRNNTKNNNLRDLIKILLIRELLGRPNHNFPPRPPHNHPQPPMRPPIMPRNYQPLYDIYEY